MFDQTRTVDLTQRELSEITSALETQRKILQVQASAGQRSARDRMNETKRILSHLRAHDDTKRNRGSGMVHRIGTLFGGFRTRHS